MIVEWAQDFPNPQILSQGMSSVGQGDWNWENGANGSCLATV